MDYFGYYKIIVEKLLQYNSPHFFLIKLVTKKILSRYLSGLSVRFISQKTYFKTVLQEKGKQNYNFSLIEHRRNMLSTGSSLENV